MKIRDYYEKLAQARANLVRELAKKKDMGEESFWSVGYNMKFKEKLYKEVINKIKSKSKSSILDLGCGQGDDLFRISKGCDFSGCGLDFSLTQLRLASSKDFSKKIKFIQANINSLPLRNNTFDIIIFSEVIEHVMDAKGVLGEIYRILKDDGYLFITTPNRYDYFHFLGGLLPLSIRKKISRSIQTKVDVDSSEYLGDLKIKEHEHLYGLGEIKTVLKESNFLIETFKSGKLTVPLPKLFDRSRLLQACWRRFDDLLIKIPISKYFRRQFIFILRKKI